jgi:large subunit ribosomal protein L28
MKCQRCGKKTRTGYNVSHAENKSSRKFKPNIQKKTYYTKKGEKVTQYLCTRCIKDLKRKGEMFYRPPESEANPPVFKATARQEK